MDTLLTAAAIFAAVAVVGTVVVGFIRYVIDRARSNIEPDE